MPGGFRPPRVGELTMPVQLGRLRLLERALEHELSIAQFTLFAIHSTRHERMNAEADAAALRDMLADIKGAV